MKNRLFYIISAVIILAAVLFSLFALMRSCAAEPVTPAAPVDTDGHDLSVSAVLLRELLSAPAAEAGVRISSLTLDAPCTVSLSGMLVTEKFAAELGPLSGIAGALLPEEMAFSLQLDLSLSGERLLLTPRTFVLGGLTVSADRLPDSLLALLSDAVNSRIPTLSGIEKIAASANYLYIWVE